MPDNRASLAQLLTYAERWQLEYLFELARRAWFVHAVVAALTGGLLLRDSEGKTWAWVWLVTMLAMTAVMLLLAHHSATTPSAKNRQIRIAGRAHSGLTGIIGVTWGLGAIGAAQLGTDELLYYSLALGGTALGAVSSQHVLPRSCFISLWSSLFPLASAHVLHRQDIRGAAFAIMIALFAAVLSTLCIRMHRFLATNHYLTQSLNEKVRELSSAKHSLEHAHSQSLAANAAKTRFLAHASHDLRQPIHAIGLFTALLHDTPQLPLNARRLIENINTSVDAVNELIRSLLDISALDAGGVCARRKPVDLGDLVERLVQQNMQLARVNGCAIRFVQTRTWVHTDATLLFTLIQNVLSNAIKYASGSDILVGTRRCAGRVSIEVHDRGPGIAAADLERIFEEFYRTDHATKRAIGGLGLGLSIVQRLSQLLGLEVRIVSQPTRGTRVTISNLMVIEALPQQRPSPRSHHPLVGCIVCVLEDDAHVRTATAMLLQRWGCTVIELDRVPDHAVGADVIIADLDLGSAEDGLSAVMKIRDLEGRKLPAIIVSGRVEAGIREALEKNNIPFLPKPVQPADLRALMVRLALAAASARMTQVK